MARGKMHASHDRKADNSIMTKQELFDIEIRKPSQHIYNRIKANWDHIAKPLDGLGKLEKIICKIGAAQDKEQPDIAKRALVIMCADNGIVAEGVSQSGQEVTLAVAKNMGAGLSSACKMSASADVFVRVIDIGINSDEKVAGVLDRKVMPGTRDFLSAPAMTEAELADAISVGIDMVRKLKAEGYEILATGEMGIGNTTTSTAVICALTGKDPDEVTGRGAGLTDSGLLRKKEVIKNALEKYNFGGDAFEILRCVGGLDIAGMCGMFIGGALYNVPIVLDGIISAAAALCAERILPGCRKYMIASHCGAEPAARPVLDELELEPVIYADLALGEGTGAVMLFPLLDMAMDVYKESSSFDDIGVEQYEKYN